jgi:hypothetical protein
LYPNSKPYFESDSESDFDLDRNHARRRKKQRREEPQLEPYSSDEFWDEMIMREVWDREVENYSLWGAKHSIAEWRASEAKRRRDWDTARKAHKVVMVLSSDKRGDEDGS